MEDADELSGEDDRIAFAGARPARPPVYRPRTFRDGCSILDRRPVIAHDDPRVAPRHGEALDRDDRVAGPPEDVLALSELNRAVPEQKLERRR